MNEEVSFGNIVKQYRYIHDLTQAELASRVACATVTIRKIEYDLLRPSRQIAERLAVALAIPQSERNNFVQLARTALLADQSPPLPIPRPVPDEIGQQDLSGRAIRGYELGERIAVGGFGAVYRAVQPYVRREVAIKIILPHYADHPDFIRRFEAEARLVAQLEHPYIVPLYDYWREPGSAYLVMRLMRGGSLQTKLKEGALALTATFRVLQQIGDALHCAHRAGIIHRDIKPGNILLDEDGNAYLADFGFAKNLGDAALVEQTQAGTIIGSLEYISPEQLQAEPVRPQSDIYCLGIVLYEILTGQKPFKGSTPFDYIQRHLAEPLPLLSATHMTPPVDPDMSATLNGVIARATAKNPLDRYPDVIAMLAELQEMLSSPAAKALAFHHKNGQLPFAGGQSAVENPYKGLRAFGEADAADFFGRDILVQGLLTRLAEAVDPATGSRQDLARFLAVVGPSGSGKSSLVRAGLIPTLRQGGLPGSEQWFIVEMLPGSHPLEELEAALLRVAINPPESLLAQLCEDERGLLRAVRRILPTDEKTELILVIDQFEELFTLCLDETVRAHLLNSLVMAVLDPVSRLRVVITMRADFTDRPLQYVDFGELVRHRTELVLPLTPDEMKEAIVGPARRVGLALEPGLPETIIGDLGNQPGTLPLLQYTLTELFERRVGNALTLGAYQTSGGVRQALVRRADKLYTDLDEAGQKAARSLFMRLITPGEITSDGLTAPDTRRRVLRAELDTLAPAAITERLGKIDMVIDQYGRHRLLTFDRDPVTRGPTVEVAHEALIREWSRLKQWLDEDREFLLWQQRLRAALRQWEASARDEGALLRGAPLAEAENWFNQRQADLSVFERSFIQAGLELREREAAEREARRQRELEAAQQLAEEQARAAAIEKQRAQEQGRTNKRLRWLAAGLVIFLLAAGVAAFLAWQQTRRAEQQARLTTARELAGAATINLDVEPERSILLALQAVDVTYDYDKTVTREAENALHRAVSASRLLLTLGGDAGSIGDLKISPDGTSLAAGSLDGIGRVWDITTGQLLLTLTGHKDFLFDVVFSPDGTRMATASYDGTAKVWDARTGRELFTLTGHRAEVNRIAISPDGTHLATASFDGTAKVWDAVTGQELFILTGHNDQVWDVNFSPDGTRLATGSVDGTARLWDAATGQELRVLTGHRGFVGTVAFSPDGKYLATSSEDRTAKVWDLANGQVLLTLAGNPSEVMYVRFSPDGTVLATATASWAKLWRLEYEGGRPIAAREWLTLAGHPGFVLGIDFTPDGKRLVTGSFDGTTKVWSLLPEHELPPLVGHKAEVFGLAFSPDGTRLVSSSFDGTTKVWDPITGQELFSLGGHGGRMYRAAFSPDGTRLAAGGGDGTAKVWDAVTGRELLTLTGHKPGLTVPNFEGVIDVAFSLDGSRLATASYDGTAKVWDAATGRELLTLSGHGRSSAGGPFGGVVSVAFSTDGARLVTAGSEGIAKVWDVTNGQELLNLAGDIGGLSDMALSPDGRILVTTSWEAGVAKVWNIALARETGAVTGQELFTLTGGSSIYGVAFSQVDDGRYLVTAHDDGAAKIWDLTTGQALLNLVEPGSGIYSVAFSPDGTRLATGSRDGTVRLYVLPLEELVSLAHSRLTRTWTTEECRQYLHVDECPTGLREEQEKP